VVISRSASATQAIAKKLARGFQGDEVVFLIGELGAGKTVFAKGIAAGLGLKSVHQVCSPTFTLMNAYEGRVPIYHFDLYRLAGAPDIADLGFEDFIGEGVVVVEWGEKIPFSIPAISVAIKVLDDERRKIEIHVPSESRGPELHPPAHRFSQRGKGRNHPKAVKAN